MPCKNVRPLGMCEFIAFHHNTHRKVNEAGREQSSVICGCLNSPLEARPTLIAANEGHDDQRQLQDMRYAVLAADAY